MQLIKNYIILLPILAFCIVSCSKWSNEKRNLYIPPVVVASPISDSAPIHGGITGTMLAGKTYTIDGDVTINKGDTVFVQPGVHVNIVNRKAGIFVFGALISLGSQSAPVWFTVDSLQKLKNDAPNQDMSKDPATAGGWVGIYCATSCPMLILKWTHIEFAGYSLSSTQAQSIGQSSQNFSILFQNSTGVFVMEDSWLYGGIDDPVRISNGKICIMRNTFEKGGLVGGDCLNTKCGTVGDMAYNLFVGMATNGQKASNKGQPTGANQTNIHMWNNTFVACGYRQAQVGRGGDIDFEEGAKGLAYNNLMVNCKFGIRIVSNPAADTANIQYGNNYSYGDSLSVVNQIYPTTSGGSGGWTRPQLTDIPNYTTFLPSTYKYADTYDGSSIVQKNNPLFYNFPLPVPKNIPLQGIQAVYIYDFRLQSKSPAIGKGFTSFSAIASVPIDPIYGVTEITSPGKDIGAFQFDGTGNQHYLH